MKNTYISKIVIFNKKIIKFNININYLFFNNNFFIKKFIKL